MSLSASTCLINPSPAEWIGIVAREPRKLSDTLVFENHKNTQALNYRWWTLSFKWVFFNSKWSAHFHKHINVVSRVINFSPCDDPFESIFYHFSRQNIRHFRVTSENNRVKWYFSSKWCFIAILGFVNDRNLRACEKKNFKMRCKFFIILFSITIASLKCDHNNSSGSKIYKSKFSIDQLLANKFENKISNDIYLDPCKSSELMRIFW